MGSSGYLLLQQSEFVSNYVGSFQELRSAGELFDVTLACEDETLEAHKVVISACSPFFRHVLTKIKQNHPFIYLKGVLHRDLVALMEYIYTGETKVPAVDVNRFIEAAQELKIKGLAEDEIETNPPNDDEKKKEGQSKEDRLTETVEINPLDYTGSEFSLLNGSSGSDYGMVENSGTISELEQEIAKKSEKVTNESGSTMWKCKDCGKECKRKDKLKEHIETHLEGFSHSCTICDREYKTRSSLSAHFYQAHRVKREVKEETENKDNTDNVVVNSKSVEEKEATIFEPVDENNQDERLRTEILKRMEKVQDTEGGSMWKCTECGKMLKKKGKLELHVETHLEGFTHRCVHCDKVHKTRGALWAHIRICKKGDE